MEGELGFAKDVKIVSNYQNVNGESRVRTSISEHVRQFGNLHSFRSCDLESVKCKFTGLNPAFRRMTEERKPRHYRFMFTFSLVWLAKLSTHNLENKGY